MDDLDGISACRLSAVALQPTPSVDGLIRVTDASFTPLDGVRYTPFGVSRDVGANLKIDHKFTGQIEDASSGLYWYASRAYDPVIGRFTAPDSVVPEPRNPQALNRYAYGLNNPLRYNDPSGHDSWDPSWTAAFQAAHGGQTATQQDWNDYQFSLLHRGSGPNGTWTDQDWQSFTDVRNTLGGLLHEVGRPQDTWSPYTLIGSLWPGSVFQSESEIGPDGTLIKFAETPNNTTAMAIGNVITINPTEGSPIPARRFIWSASKQSLRALVAHEYTHVLQYRALGWTFLMQYQQGGFYNWRGNPLEVPAVHIQDVYSEPRNAWLPPPWEFVGVAP